MCDYEEGNPLVLGRLKFTAFDVYADSTCALVQQSKLWPSKRILNLGYVSSM